MRAGTDAASGVPLAWWERLQGKAPAQWPILAQLAAALGLAAAIAMLGSLLLVRMAHEDRAQEKDRQARLQQQYRERLTVRAGLPALRAQAAAMGAQRERMAALRPMPARTAAVLASVHQAAASHGVQVERLQPGKEKLLDGHARQWLQLRAEGDYAGVTGFLQALQRLPFSVVPERWSLAPVRTAAGRGRGSLTLQARIGAYRFTEAGERPAGKRRKSAGAKS